MTSIRIFPRVVLLAYVLFLVYFLSHPLGFSYIALATSFCYVTVHMHTLACRSRARLTRGLCGHLWRSSACVRCGMSTSCRPYKVAASQPPNHGSWRKQAW